MRFYLYNTELYLFDLQTKKIYLKPEPSKRPRESETKQKSDQSTIKGNYSQMNTKSGETFCILKSYLTELLNKIKLNPTYNLDYTDTEKLKIQDSLSKESTKNINNGPLALRMDNKNSNLLEQHSDSLVGSKS
jgi:hypothetical protein